MRSVPKITCWTSDLFQLICKMDATLSHCSHWHRIRYWPSQNGLLLHLQITTKSVYHVFQNVLTPIICTSGRGRIYPFEIISTGAYYEPYIGDSGGILFIPSYG